MLLSVRCFPDKSDGVVCVRNSSSFEGSPTSPIKKPNMTEPPACSQMAADSDCWPWIHLSIRPVPLVFSPVSYPSLSFLTAVLHWDHFCWEFREQQTISRRSWSSLLSSQLFAGLFSCFFQTLLSFLRIFNSSFVCAEILFYAVKLCFLWDFL